MLHLQQMKIFLAQTKLIRQEINFQIFFFYQRPVQINQNSVWKCFRFVRKSKEQISLLETSFFIG